jgi:hypothetical protein
VQRRSITRGVVVLRLRGSEPSCSEAGSNCAVTPPNRDLSEPFGRSGTLVHITLVVLYSGVSTRDYGAVPNLEYSMIHDHMSFHQNMHWYRSQCS